MVLNPVTPVNPSEEFCRIWHRRSSRGVGRFRRPGAVLSAQRIRSPDEPTALSAPTLALTPRCPAGTRGMHGNVPHPLPLFPGQFRFGPWAAGLAARHPPPAAFDRPMLTRRCALRPLGGPGAAPAMGEGRPRRKLSGRARQGRGDGCHRQLKAGASARRSWGVAVGAGAGRSWAVMRGAW